MMENSVCSQEVSLVFVIPDGLTEDTCESSLICAFQVRIEGESTSRMSVVLKHRDVPGGRTE